MARTALTGTVAQVNHPTARVKVESMQRHHLYEKPYRVTRSFLVHVPEGTTVQAGDTVEITEGRPVSKRKSWTLTRVVTCGSVIQDSEELA